MTPNLSLQKSTSLRDYYRLDFLQTLYDVFPFEVIEQFIAKGSRDRVYSNENTILTMVYSVQHRQIRPYRIQCQFFENVYTNQKQRIIEDNFCIYCI